MPTLPPFSTRSTNSMNQVNSSIINFWHYKSGTQKKEKRKKKGGFRRKQAQWRTINTEINELWTTKLKASGIKNKILKIHNLTIVAEFGIAI